jgi:hypothetical protein
VNGARLGSACSYSTQNNILTGERERRRERGRASMPACLGRRNGMRFAGITFGAWATLLWRRGHAVEWKHYWVRVLFLTAMSLLNSLLAVFDSFLFGRAVQSTALQDPVFVLGAHRRRPAAARVRILTPLSLSLSVDPRCHGGGEQATHALAPPFSTTCSAWTPLWSPRPPCRCAAPRRRANRSPTSELGISAAVRFPCRVPLGDPLQVASPWRHLRDTPHGQHGAYAGCAAGR